jgi:hypothetical protein
MKVRQVLEDLIATPATQSHKKVANNSIPNRTKRKGAKQSNHNQFNNRAMLLNAKKMMEKLYEL